MALAPESQLLTVVKFAHKIAARRKEQMRWMQLKSALSCFPTLPYWFGSRLEGPCKSRGSFTVDFYEDIYIRLSKGIVYGQ